MMLVPKRDEFEAPSRKRLDRWRDVVAMTVANWMLNHVATKWYRVRIEALLLIGFGAVTRPKNDGKSNETRGIDTTRPEDDELQLGDWI